jgi:hypothetical protein
MQKDGAFYGIVGGGIKYHRTRRPVGVNSWYQVPRKAFPSAFAENYFHSGG